MKSIMWLVGGTCLCVTIIVLIDEGYLVDQATDSEGERGWMGYFGKGPELARGRRLVKKENLMPLLATSAALPFLAFCFFCTTHHRVFIGLAVLCHGVVLQQVGGKSWAHILASMVAYVLVEGWKFLDASKQLREWRAEIKRAEDQAEEGVGGGGDEKKRVLILYANVGSGHKSAANAIEEAFKERAGSVEVQKLDVLDLCSPAFRFGAQTMFQKLTQSLAGQHMLGFLYDMGDHGNEKGKVQRALEDHAGIGLAKVLTKFRPTNIICTHFLPCQLVGTLKRTSRVLGSRLKLGLVITDLDLQSMWVQEGAVDAYYLPREDSAVVLKEYESQAREMRKKGEKSKLTTVSKSVLSGIPIMPEFSKAAREMHSTEGGAFKYEAMRTFGLDPIDKRPVVVVMSGGKLIKQVYENCLSCEIPLRFVVVMGRQADVREVLEKVHVPPRHLVKLVGFCREMPKLLAAADLMVGKCGGLTAAENAALGVPLIILDPIPGQEQRNSDCLLQTGGALKVNDLPLLNRRLTEVFDNERKLLISMQKGIKVLAKPESCFTIVEDIMKG